MQGKWMMGCSTEFMEPVHTDTDDKRGDKRYQEVKKKRKIQRQMPMRPVRV